MNNKGFMMAEVIVVASIVMIALVGLYTSYNKIFSIYNQRVNYYDVATLYELANVRNGVDFASYTSMTTILDDGGNVVYYLNKNDISKLDVKNQTFKDYLEFISESTDTFDTDNILVMERCIDGDNCKYAYLEVFLDETS